MIRFLKYAILAAVISFNANGLNPTVEDDMMANVTVAGYSYRELECLTKAVYGEAGNQSMKGKIAVAHVIINRVKHKSYPSGVCAVTHQRGQFDFLSSKRKIDYNNVLEIRKMRESIKATLLVVSGKVSDPTRGALFFANPKASTDKRWLRGLVKIVQIDDHVFYHRKKISYS